MINSILEHPDLTGFFGSVLFWTMLGLWVFWPNLQNFRTRAYAGRGPLHREPGLPSVLKLVPSPRTPAERVRAVDLSRLVTVAAGPLVPKVYELKDTSRTDPRIVQLQLAIYAAGLDRSAS